MEALSERVDRISLEAQEVHFGRTLLTLLATLLYGLGWLVAKACIVLWLTLAWSATAVRLGWQDAHKSRRHRIASP